VRSERQFCERLQYDLLFKWFLDLNVADPGFSEVTVETSSKPGACRRTYRPSTHAGLAPLSDVGIGRRLGRS